MPIDKFLQKWRAKLTWRNLAKGVLIAIFLLLLGLFFDWLIINWLLGCCEGGVCWPDIYPQCRNEHYQEFYGSGHDQR